MLDLITPSNKKHPVSDSNEYWSLTDLGKKLLAKVRKYRLMQAKKYPIKKSSDPRELDEETSSMPDIETEEITPDAQK